MLDSRFRGNDAPVVMPVKTGIQSSARDLRVILEPMLELRQSGPDVLLSVFIQPRASRNALAGIHAGALKLQLTAPPVDGAANDACVRFLADVLDLHRSDLSIVKGTQARRKLIRITQASAAELRERLEGLLRPLDSVT